MSMPAGSFTVTNATGLTITDNTTVSQSVNLSTLTWLRLKSVRVVLTNLSHNFPDDLDFLLVGPDGRNLEFWSDAGGTADITSGNFTISDNAAAPLPNSTLITSGAYRPTDYTDLLGVETSSNWSGAPSIPINHPGPTGAATLTSVVAGAWVPDTTYTLYVRDDEFGIAGSLGSWSLEFDYQTIVKPHGFHGGFNSDILFQNNDGSAGIWRMGGFTETFAGNAGPHGAWPYAGPGPSWHIKGDGDFNDDGRSDILWQNDDGTPGIWLMNGFTATEMGPVGTNPGPSWHVKGTGDFNFDGKADILWQNDDGTAGIWLMNGLNVLASSPVGTNPGPSWQVKAAADFNNDGKADILWQNADGTPGIWLMDGLNVIGVGQPHTNPGPNWQIKGTGDFNNDGKADILWQHTDGTAAIWLMNGLTAVNVGAVGSNPGAAWHVMGSGDYNGDLNSDILWQNDDGTPGIWMMDGLTVLSAGVAGSFNPGTDWHVIG
jgi:hypothetical protein